MILGEKQEVFEKLLRSFEAYFDLAEDVTLNGVTYAATGEFHSRSEKYVLSKKAQLWAAENHEYIYFVVLDTLDEEAVRFYGRSAIDEGMACIKPHSEHMYSYISLIFITDRITEEAAALLQKTNYRKQFLLTFHGWMEFRAVAYECTNGRILYNRSGKALAKQLI